MRSWLAAVLLLVLPWSLAVPVAAPRETDLDRFMAAVLSRRDENWKKLQQYILDERERVLVTGPGGLRLFGMSRDYRWFQKDGFFIRSPLTANGVGVNDTDRRRYEADWLKRQQRRDEDGRRVDGEEEGPAQRPDDLAADGDRARGIRNRLGVGMTILREQRDWCGNDG